jgi:hypothetical protein
MVATSGVLDGQLLHYFTFSETLQAVRTLFFDSN